MSSRDNPLWLQLWRDRRLEFHQLKVNPLLVRFWAQSGQSPGSRVFIPLCGKSLDMIWLAEQGHEVIGIELSPIAVEDFFRENNLQPVKIKKGEFIEWKSGNISILCGDYFSLQKKDIGRIDIVYDRAALTALPEDIREHYVSHLRSIISRKTSVFLLTIEDAEDDLTLKQALGIDSEIQTLYSKYFSIKLAHVESTFESDTDLPDQLQRRVEYKVYWFSVL